MLRIQAKVLSLFVLIWRAAAMSKSVFDFNAVSSSGNTISLSTFSESPVLVIVNVASACGYTNTNYRELQQLYEKYKNRGFNVIAFPCNQFGKQEPGTIEEIQCFVTDRFSVSFPLMDKVDVNGSNAHPLFPFLKASTDQKDIAWNFTKYLVVNGIPRKKYSHSTPPSSFEDEIVEALNEASIKSEL